MYLHWAVRRLHLLLRRRHLLALLHSRVAHVHLQLPLLERLLLRLLMLLLLLLRWLALRSHDFLLLQRPRVEGRSLQGQPSAGELPLAWHANLAARWRVGDLRSPPITGLVLGSTGAWRLS